MSPEERVAARGTWGRVDWALDARGYLPGREFFRTLDEEDRAKVLALFKRLADVGRINSEQKFKNVGQGLWEFKSFQVRLLGGFRPGYRFVVSHGLVKKQDGLRKADIKTAQRILSENDAKEGATT